jgi:hypothetical protein
MKPLHVGLLVAGAAVAGALAVKMTEPPALPAPGHYAPGGAKKSGAESSGKVSRQDVIPQTISQSAAESATFVPAARNATLVTVAPGATMAPVARSVTSPTVTQSAGSSPVAQSATTIPIAATASASRGGTAEADTSAPPPVYSEPRHNKPTPFAATQPQQKVEIASTTLPNSGLTHRPAPYQQPGADQTSQLMRQIEEPHAPRQVTLEPGMILSIRLMETLSSDRVSTGDAFSASLAEPLVVDGLIVAERGSRVDGRVLSVARPSRIGGRSELQLQVSKITTADGQRIAISTDPWKKTNASSRTMVAQEIGGGAALGAIIGAVAGGGPGAAIGAGVGTGAGIGTAMATRPKPVTVATESVIVFRVNSRVRITERQL